MKKRILPAIVFLVVVAGGGYLVWSRWSPGSDVAGPDAAGRSESVATAEETTSAAETVTLPEGKYRAAGIELVEANRRMLQHHHVVPGRLAYDDRRHVEVKVATAGILSDVRVKPGDRVQTGDVLATLSSPEVGTARADVKLRESEYALATRRLEWAGEIWSNVQGLVDALQHRRPMGEIERDFENRTFGDYREELVAAYSRFLLAESLAAGVESVARTGSVSQRMLSERASERQSAEASLKAACEQALFDARQQRDQAEMAAEDARRRLEIARHHVTALLGYEEVEPKRPADSDTTARPLSLVEVQAPFSGTIEQRMFSATERVAQGESLFVLADTSRLWVRADIREQDWEALNLEESDEVIVETPAIPGGRFPATVYYVGREVDPETNAVGLIAALGNGDGQLRPGLFARVVLPVGEPREVLTVPAAAVVDHEGAAFVFVEAGERTFRRVDVETGDQDGEWLEIVSGLEPGARVVTSGAFYLKSELLLEGEEE